MGLNRALTRALSVPLSTRLDIEPGFGNVSASAAAALAALYSRSGDAFVMEFSGTPSAYISDSGTPANDRNTTIADLNTFTGILEGTAPKITRQADGDWKYQPHNLYLNSAAPANQAITVLSGHDYKIVVTGTVSITLSGAGTGTVTSGSPISFTASTTTLTCGSTSGSGTVHVFKAPAVEDYLPTTSSARYALPIEHDASGDAIGVRSEAQATNLLEHSNGFSTAAWSTSVSGGLTVTSDDGVSPSGLSDADLLVPNAVSGYHVARQQTASTAAVHGQSVFVEAAGYSRVAIRDDYTTGHYASFLLSGDGSVVNKTASASATITAVGNDWYRIEFVGIGTGSNAGIGIYVLDDSYVSGDPASHTYTGDGTSGLHVWIAQFELASVTSPIITAGSAATRPADAFSKLLSTIPFSATVGTLRVKYKPTDSATEAEIVKLDDTTANEVIAVGHTSGAAAQLDVTDGGVAQTAPLTTGTVVTDASTIVAATWKADDFLISKDGATAVADTSGTLPTLTRLIVGHGVIESILYTPEENSAAEIEAMSS